MKTLTTSIEKFATDSITKQEMNFLMGGGKESPIDMMAPPIKY
jgi:hypothetical protein